MTRSSAGILAFTPVVLVGVAALALAGRGSGKSDTGSVSA